MSDWCEHATSPTIGRALSNFLFFCFCRFAQDRSIYSFLTLKVSQYVYICLCVSELYFWIFFKVGHGKGKTVRGGLWEKMHKLLSGFIRHFVILKVRWEELEIHSLNVFQIVLVFRLIEKLCIYVKWNKFGIFDW